MRKILLLVFISLNLVFGQELLITEIMYNPDGSDKDREWIEVINNSTSSLSIIGGRSGWRINDGNNHLFKNNMTILPGEVFLIVQDQGVFGNSHLKILEANFNLKNESGEIKILDNNQKLMALAKYSSKYGANGNGLSLVLTDKGWQESIPSPGIYPNQISQNSQNLAPLEKEEKFTVTTTESSFQESKSSFNASIEEDQRQNTTPPSLIITEFLPNPEANDRGKEFVEIYNPGSDKVNLDEFKLVINDRKISLSGIIFPQEYKVIWSKIAIRNSGEEIILTWQDQKIFQINYEGKAPVGMSFARNEEGKWQFTRPTPGQKNVFVGIDREEKEFNSLVPKFNRPFERGVTTTKINNQKIGTDRNNVYILLMAIFLILLLSFIVWFKL